MVEKFFNSRRFRYTLAYLFRDETLSPWAFFAALARFGRAQGFSGQARKPVALYNGLWRFLTGEFLTQRRAKAVAGGTPAGPLNLRLLSQRHRRCRPGVADTPGGDLREAVKELLKDPEQKVIPLPPDRSASEVRRRMLVFSFGLDPETGEEGCCPVAGLPAGARPSRLASAPAGAACGRSGSWPGCLPIRR